jgi:NSS family neurotransmitter:Na+ symporter
VHYGPDRLRAEIRGIPGDWDPGKAWIFAVTYVVPTLTLALLGFWLYVSATRYARETWWDPLDPFSVATCILQWGLAGGGLLVANAFLVRKLRRGLSPDSPPPDVR